MDCQLHRDRSSSLCLKMLKELEDPPPPLPGLAELLGQHVSLPASDAAAPDTSASSSSTPHGLRSCWTGTVHELVSYGPEAGSHFPPLCSLFRRLHADRASTYASRHSRGRRFRLVIDCMTILMLFPIPVHCQQAAGHDSPLGLSQIVERTEKQQKKTTKETVSLNLSTKEGVGKNCKCSSTPAPISSASRPPFSFLFSHYSHATYIDHSNVQTIQFPSAARPRPQSVCRRHVVSSPLPSAQACPKEM